MKKKFYPERDELRGRFTRFMEVLVKHARINYVHMRDRGVPTIPLETVPEHLAAKEEMYFSGSQEAFEFEEEKLANAFAHLSLMRREILTLLFVQEMKPSDIADRLHCSVQYVYNQKSLALKKLRQLLKETASTSAERR